MSTKTETIQDQATYSEHDRNCTRGEHVGHPRKVVPGSWAIELLLLICEVVPGVVYSIWRGRSFYRVCNSCGSREIVPLTSPVAHRAMGGDR